MKEFITNSVEETMKLAQSFTDHIQEGCVISLIGDLGVGKTAFTKGVGLSLGIKETISSPTFTLLKEYEGRLKLKHIDAYRLENTDASSLALYDLIDDDAIIIIEWGNFIDDLIPDYIIHIDYLDENKRKITIQGVQYGNTHH